MAKYFGTDGFRGEAGITLTADHAYKVGRFLGWYYNALRECNDDNDPARIVIGKDTRRSSYMFEYSLVAGLTASGADAYLLHVTTTPSVAYIARVDDFDCGIMISASHNPYYDNGIKLEQAYDRKHLPPIWIPENSILELKIRATGEDDPKKQEWVQLPASRIKLERAMLRAGIPSCGEMQMLVSDSRFPDEVDCALDFEHESLFELNRMCQACSNFKEQDFVKLGAVCQMAKPTCAANIRQLAENLDQFDFAPNVHTPEELGKYMIQQSGHYEYDENLEDFYNYGDYGASRMLQEDGVFVDRGYVSYHGTLTLDELMRDDPAESYQQEQDVRMEGMAW